MHGTVTLRKGFTVRESRLYRRLCTSSVRILELAAATVCGQAYGLNGEE